MPLQTPQTLLIIDDNEMNREILRLNFLDRFTIVEACNGLEALNYVKDHNDEICAVLLDKVMPVMDAIDFLHEVKNLNLLKAVPIFIVTAQADAISNFVNLDLGITDVIEKPFNAAFLKKRVCSQVELFLTRRSLEYTNLKQREIIEQKTRDFAELNVKVITTLALAIEFRSGEVGEHVQNIRSLTRAILRKMREIGYEGCADFSDEKIELISYASILHDVGKIAISDLILNKPGKLTPEEYEVVKTHSKKGAEIISKINIDESNPIMRYAYDICLHHHERYDGKGYPDGLKGDEISIEAQVVGLADVYDALTQERCYKRAFSKEEAINMMVTGQCGSFNPKLLAVFVSIIGKLDFEKNTEEDQKALKTLAQSLI